MCVFLIVFLIFGVVCLMYFFIRFIWFILCMWLLDSSFIFLYSSFIIWVIVVLFVLGLLMNMEWMLICFFFLKLCFLCNCRNCMYWVWFFICFLIVFNLIRLVRLFIIFLKVLFRDLLGVKSMEDCWLGSSILEVFFLKFFVILNGIMARSLFIKISLVV